MASRPKILTENVPIRANGVQFSRNKKTSKQPGFAGRAPEESQITVYKQKQKVLKLKIRENDYLKNAISQEFPRLAARVAQFADSFDDKRYVKFVLSFRNAEPPFRELALDAAEEAKSFKTFREFINLIDMDGSAVVKKVAIENFLEYRAR
jgi:hypothetical protein